MATVFGNMKITSDLINTVSSGIAKKEAQLKSTEEKVR